MLFFQKQEHYLSSLVTITPTRSTLSSRYISLVISKANTTFGHLSFQFSAANDWNEFAKIAEVGDISPSLTLSISYLSSLPIAGAVHSPSVNSPSNYLPHPHIVFINFFALLRTSISTCTSSSAHLSLQCSFAKL